MPDEDSVSTNIPMTLEGPIARETLSRLLVPHSDLTYRKLQDLKISEVNLYQSLITGSLIRDCLFTQVSFQRADLDGVRGEKSTFVECNFTRCDFRSSHFTRCKFVSCVFDETFINDCEFHECEWISCSFKGASLSESRLHQSVMDGCTLSQGTFIHNWLYQCRISNMVIGDCTFLYVILRNGEFEKVTINADSVGAILGLTREHLTAADLMFLGKQEAIPAGFDVVELLSEEYGRRQWYIGELILALNFHLTSTVEAFDTYLSKAFGRFAEMGFAKGDEMQFVGDVLEELAALEKLPLLTAINVMKWCAALESKLTVIHEARPEATDRALRVLASRMSLTLNSLFDKVEEAAAPLQSGENETPVYLKITFRERPAIPLDELLNSITESSTLNIPQKSRLVRTETGSYIAIVYTTLFTIFALRTFLFLINGCIIQLTEMKYRIKVLTRKQAPKAYNDLASLPTQQISPLMLSVLQGLMQYAKNLNWLKDASLAGYETSNIQKVEIWDNVDQRNS